MPNSSLMAHLFNYFQKEHSKERNKKKEKQPKEENNETQTSQDNVDVITSPSMSFYAVSAFILMLNYTNTSMCTYLLENNMRYFQSLDPRPRSIYDALDCSATNPVPDQSRAKPKNVVPPNKVSFLLRGTFHVIHVYIDFTLIINNCVWHYHPSTGGADCSDPARWVCLWELLIQKINLSITFGY